VARSSNLQVSGLTRDENDSNLCAIQHEITWYRGCKDVGRRDNGAPRSVHVANIRDGCGVVRGDGLHVVPGPDHIRPSAAAYQCGCE
jgi:hypothetical protein